MSTIMHWLGIPLGYIMYFCYHAVGSYALAILLFTLVTKVILLPVAIWVQNNGIKIVRLTPELNHIKANFLGDKDRIAEETQKLYKREKYNAFANLIPTFIQLILLIGLIQVIYHPLNNIFHMSDSLAAALVQLTVSSPAAMWMPARFSSPWSRPCNPASLTMPSWASPA